MKFINSIKTIGEPNIHEKTYHVAFTGTQNYLPWIGVAMASIMEHNQAHFMFHILLDKTTKEDISAFEEFAQQWNVSIVLYYMNDDILSQYCRFKRYLINGKYVAALMYRFIIPEIMQTIADRVLYLDGDVVCNGNITKFINIDLNGGAAIVAAEDLCGEKYARQLNIKRYFNSGVLLINVKRWNAENITSKIMGRIRKESAENQFMPCPDQDILNIYLADKTHFVSHKYNLPYRLVQASFFKPKIINEDPMQASLIHFIGAIKPWTTYNQSVPIVKVWAQAKSNSPWKDVPLHSPSSQKAIHQAARDARRRHCYGEMMMWYLKFVKSKIDGTKKVGY